MRTFQVKSTRGLRWKRSATILLLGIVGLVSAHSSIATTNAQSGPATAVQEPTPVRVTRTYPRASVGTSDQTKSGRFYVTTEFIPPGQNVAQTIARIQFEPGVTAVDLERYATTDTDDTYLPYQWALLRGAGGSVNAVGAWERTTGERSVIVAVIDTGIVSHPDLDAAVRLDWGVDMISLSATARDGSGRDMDATDPGDWCLDDDSPASSWHGTHVAGIIAAQKDNGIGISGVAPNVTIMPIRVLGACGGSVADVTDGIRWAAGLSTDASGNPWSEWGLTDNLHPADVLNLSLGGWGSCSSSGLASLSASITAARNAGAVVVVAAGNDAYYASSYWPASCNSAFTVASLGSNGQRAAYSNFGVSVDIAAPGGQGSGALAILSTIDSGTTVSTGASYAYYSGTSMAAPFVSGIAALMFSVNSSYTPLEVEERIKAKSKPFPVYSSGGIDTCISRQKQRSS